MIPTMTFGVTKSISSLIQRFPKRNVRFLSSQNNSAPLKSFTEKCPSPQYDTGCTFCSIDFPPDKPIDYAQPLNGTAAVPWKHMLVLSHGVSDFDEMPSKINLIPGSLAQDFELIKRKMLSPMHPVILSNASIGQGHIGQESKMGQTEKASEQGSKRISEKHRVRIYPDNIEVEFAPDQLEDFVQTYLVPDEKVQVYNPFQKQSGQGHKLVKNNRQGKVKNRVRRDSFLEKKIQKDLVLICAHTKRDIRCGLLAGPLEEEFQKVLEKEQLSEKVEVGRISHIGGHVYAGNVIYFPQDPTRSVVWYGRVFPPNVQGIVLETIKNGAIIKELYRGQVDP